MAFPSRCYHYSFEVCESPPIRRDWGEDDDDEEDTFITVKMCFLKIDESAAAADIECFVHLSAVVTMEERPVLDVSECLKEIGVPEVCHARMVAELMNYINAQVIMVSQYETETVVMNIVQTSTGVVEGRVLEEALRQSESEDGHMESGRQWMVMDMGVQESWAWPEEAEGNIQVAVEILRTPEWSTVTMEHQPQQYFEVVVFQPQDNFEVVVNRSMEGYRAPWMVPASEAAIANLEKIEQGEVGAMSCVICEDEDEQGVFSRMPCMHAFHSKCIETWLGTSSSCPLCRYALS